jgi:subtilase family serine protease
MASPSQMGGLPDASRCTLCGATTAATTGGDDGLDSVSNNSRWGPSSNRFHLGRPCRGSVFHAATTLAEQRQNQGASSRDEETCVRTQA